VPKKSLLLLILAAIAGFFVYRKVQADRAEQDLWTEATDPIATPAPAPATTNATSPSAAPDLR
jgi:hypothetical protein